MDLPIFISSYMLVSFYCCALFMTFNHRPSPGNLLDGLFKDSSRTMFFRILFYVVSSTPVLVSFFRVSGCK